MIYSSLFTVSHKKTWRMWEGTTHALLYLPRVLKGKKQGSCEAVSKSRTKIKVLKSVGWAPSLVGNFFVDFDFVKLLFNILQIKVLIDLFLKPVKVILWKRWIKTLIVLITMWVVRYFWLKLFSSTNSAFLLKSNHVCKHRSFILLRSYSTVFCFCWVTWFSSAKQAHVDFSEWSWWQRGGGAWCGVILQLEMKTLQTAMCVGWLLWQQHHFIQTNQNTCKRVSTATYALQISLTPKFTVLYSPTLFRIQCFDILYHATFPTQSLSGVLVCHVIL